MLAILSIPLKYTTKRLSWRAGGAGINASRQKRKRDFDKIADMAGETFMPLRIYGGGVKPMRILRGTNWALKSCG